MHHQMSVDDHTVSTYSDQYKPKTHLVHIG